MKPQSADSILSRIDDMTSPPLLIQAVLALTVLTAAVYDIRFRRIPNWLTLSGVLLGIGLNTVPGLGGVGIGRALLGLGLAFLVYFPLYLLRGMGAGDVKLMAAVGALVGPMNWFGIFVLTSVLGGALALIFVIFKGRLWRTVSNLTYMLKEMAYLRPPYLKREELDVKSRKGVSLPHGVMIAIGSVGFLAAAAIWGPK